MVNGSGSQLKKLITELDWKQANVGYHDGYIQLEERKKMIRPKTEKRATKTQKRKRNTLQMLPINELAKLSA